MFGYIGDLRSKTQGRAMFTMQMDSYAEVPKNVSEEIIKAQRGSDTRCHWKWETVSSQR